MRNFKKIFFPIIIIVITFALVSVAVICPYMNSETFYYEDKNLREDLTGKLDYLIIGSSQGLVAFKPTVLDDKIGCSSYNLSGSMMAFPSRYYLLKKEIERNPINTVVIEVSQNALTGFYDNSYGEGEAVFLPRLDNMAERLSFLLKYVKVNDWLNIYARMFIQGMGYYKYRRTSFLNREAKGYYAKETNNIIPDKEYIVNNYNKKKVSNEYSKSSIKYLEMMVDLCKDNDIRVIVAVVPISDISLWQYDNYDDFNNWMKDFCMDKDCEYYNFNLLKNRSDLFSDSSSFFDDGHLSDDGATVFSKEFSEIMRKVNQGEAIDAYFYDGYEIMKQDMPYMLYLKRN